MTDSAGTSSGAAASVPATSPARPKRSLVGQLRRRWPWLDHALRANESYTDHHGNYYAAAITYFSVLSLVPILMVAFAVAAFVLAGNASLLDQLQSAVTRSVPGSLGDTINKVITTAIDSRDAVGVVGLVVALYSGIGWMANLRAALTEQWGQPRTKHPLLPTLGKDLLALIGLGVALLVALGITAAGSGVGSVLLRLAGLDRYGWAQALLVVLTVVLAVAADWLVFVWVIARLPRQPVGWRRVVHGALLAAIGFEILKQLATVLLRSAMQSPTAVLFGSIIGLLVFVNLVSRLLLLATAWTATERPSARRDGDDRAPAATGDRGA